ncbi:MULTISPECIES: ferritin-like domain-containing protein [Spirulina sp. CCY15215]|uniref:ferritin-like domain-containing protein n=1 Tax=Spirulina sp. CCY15215 TaxID=2767591 RepID=UPI001951BD93|nr:ferritin-like domain-containing protein [Spirulina major]
MSSSTDPISPLTWEEHLKTLFDDLFLTREQALQELKENLQTAVQIELATIPIYLYTYYSINRIHTRGENVDNPSLYANKAAGIMMSIAVEEMLHMSLSANILYSLGVEPQLYKRSPNSYPTPLPSHNPKGPPGPDRQTKVLVPLSKFSYEQLWHCLQIEYPEPKIAWPKDRNWNTIGQFYSYIRCLIECHHLKDEDFQVNGAETQIQSYNYSPNSIDTIYPAQKFDPWKTPEGSHPGGYPSAAAVAQYPNKPDSHAGHAELITISSKREALEAIATICDQGEGYAHREIDDPSQSEYSHYYKFLGLQAQLERYEHHIEKLPNLPKPPAPITPTITDTDLEEIIYNFPDNPTTAGYPQDYQALSNLCNGVYQYMLILTETIYKVPNPEQKLFFNEAMHRSMLWVLNRLIKHTRTFVMDNGYNFAPTFENIDLGSRQDAYTNLLALTEKITEESQLKVVKEMIETIKTLPDAGPYWK